MQGEQNSIRNSKILIVDDDQAMRSLLSDFLSGQGYECVQCPSAVLALEMLEVDLVITDLRMPQMDGMQFIEKVKLAKPDLPILMITAFGSIETAIEAIRRGAFDYIVKPFKLAEIGVTIERALQFSVLKRDNTILRQQVQKPWAHGDLHGKSEGMKAVFELVDRVSVAMANVLITGESGTGKEMIAREIHRRGPRADLPFVAINCTAIPETLLESELFGHAKGSFTGAVQRKKGLFEEANRGTLFLDEIGDMEPSLQAKLLRVIQERKIRAVGDTVSRDVDVRIIAATHKDLKAAIKDGRFREDLFYRLAVIPISIPPLRHRQKDIPLLAEHFLRKYAAANHSNIKGFTPAAMDHLLRQPWEGNVRELENLVERAVVLCRDGLIDVKDLATNQNGDNEEFYGRATEDSPTLEELEKRYMRLILEKTGGKKDKAAQILGINRRTLYRKEREFGFVSPESPEEEPESNG
jgi:two-component system response regulator HydG